MTKIYKHHSQDILEQYTRDAYLLFLQKIEILVDFKRKFTFDDEKQLKVMFELLVDARITLED